MRPTLGQALARPRNAFSGLRLALALAVVVSHASSVVTGDGAGEPLARATGFALGEHAVNGFFAVSGFLVTMSFDRRGLRDYALARTLRILPGLVAATLVVALGLGALMTRLSPAEYYAAPELWRFVVGTLTRFKSNASLPGVFADNPFHAPLGTVWTLKYESLCYLGVAAAGLLGLLRRRGVALGLGLGLALALAGLGLMHPAPGKGVETALRLPLIFATGAALYLWRDRVRLSPLWLIALPASLLLREGVLYRPVLFLAESYAAIWLALTFPVERPGLARLADPPADLSYGVYLYGWPIQQTLRALWPDAGVAVLLGPSLALALAVAALSWYAVEKPALGLKARALGRRTLGTIEPAGP